ncbi:Ribonuclease H [Abeliophyllum distichum]|uniref:Ribonuclease H n=1 Tax=Abeliophyllum distichum TaxID=126358 RepID=A0ABD1V2H1_9LAMI
MLPCCRNPKRASPYCCTLLCPRNVSSVLVREEEHQLPIYYVSKALLGAEARYPDMEKLALSLITASRKLRPYFLAHSIHVLSNFPLRQIMQKTEASGRLLKWAIELSQFDIVYKPRAAIKGQALADFIAEFTNPPVTDVPMTPTEPLRGACSSTGRQGTWDQEPELFS